MKTHVSLATRDLDASVSFFQTLLNAAPVKRFDDYALFVANDPALELALERTGTTPALGGVHFGIVVDDRDAVNVAIARLRAAGHRVDIEDDRTCCYAEQYKVWSTDPDGRRWETYVVLDESTDRDDASRCDAADGNAATCC